MKARSLLLVAGAAAASVIVPLSPPARAVQPVDMFDLGLDANSLVYEAHSNTLFVSVGNNGTAEANAVVPVDVATGRRGSPIHAGLEPNEMAVSDDGQYLYVGLDATGSVARVSLATRTVDLEWALGGTSNGVYRVADMAVQPGNPLVVAVAQYGSVEDTVLFDNGVRRGAGIPMHGPTEVEFGDDPSILYGYDNGNSGQTLSRIRVDAQGLTTITALGRVVSEGYKSQLWYDGGKLFVGRSVVDAATLTLQGRFPGYPEYFEEQYLVPDVASGRAYLIGRWTTLANTYDVRSTVRVFDVNTYLQIDEFDLQKALGGLNDEFGDFISVGSGDFAVAADGTTFLFNLATLRGSAGEYTPLTPERVLDTRTGLGTAGRTDPVGPGGVLEVQITGLAGVPAAGVDAVVVNATVAAPSERSYLTVWPNGGTMPEASNLNWSPGETRANLVTVLLGAGGRLQLFNERGTAHVIFDVVGYYAAYDGPEGSRFRPLPPQRAFDTRSGSGGVPARPVGAGETLRFGITGRAGVPDAGVTAVALNVTAVDASAGSYVTVWPDDVGQPNASNINFGAGATVPNLVIVRVPASGVVDFSNFDGQVHLLADVVGYYTSDRSGQAGRFVSAWPQRIVDTRVDSPYDPPGNLWPDDTLYFEGEGEPYAAYVLNVTVTGTVGAGYVSVHPWPGEAPDSSSLNYTNDVSVPNAVIVRTGPGIAFSNYTGFTHLIADVFGAFTS